MTCPNCGHVYPISNGIPNMVRDSCSLFCRRQFSLFVTLPPQSYWQNTRLGSVHLVWTPFVKFGLLQSQRMNEMMYYDVLEMTVRAPTLIPGRVRRMITAAEIYPVPVCFPAFCPENRLQYPHLAASDLLAA